MYPRLVIGCIRSWIAWCVWGEEPGGRGGKTFRQDVTEICNDMFKIDPKNGKAVICLESPRFKKTTKKTTDTYDKNFYKGVRFVQWCLLYLEHHE